MPAAKTPLKKLPGFSQGVRDNAAARMITLARPICPQSAIEMEYDAQNRPRPKAGSQNRQNCQLAGGEWWKDCEERGHNPYFTVKSWDVPEPIIEEDAQGRMVKVGEQFLHYEEVYPNVAQVAGHIRVNQGQGAKKKIEKHGFKRLTDIGYEEVCQFRNCQKPITAAGTSRVYGLYCSREHLGLIAADAQGVMLVQPKNFGAGETEKAKNKRQKQIQEALQGA